MSSSAQVARERRAARDAENRDPATFASPTLECDIVMKGGITSGVVYPGAVLRLARRYRFRSIGGTSAGAIAAAIVAAAEHARATGSFAKLADLPQELAAEVDGRPFMLQLFQADEPTRPLFDSITGFMQHGRARGFVGLLRRFWRAPLAALVIAVAAILLSALAGVDAAFAVAGVAIALIVLAAGLVADVLGAVRRIAANDFGMCRLGPPPAGTTRPPALTEWLHAKIQAVGNAPPDAPLTFADLWGVPAPTTAEPWAEEERHAELLRRSRSPDARAVDLQMVTTDLTHGRPIRLPVPYQPHAERLEEEAGRLLFDPAEMRQFFPEEVVAHLERFSEPLATTERDVSELQPDRTSLRRFPIGPDLPIVVATRMSLSFPFLVSAIPLYRVEHLPGGRKRLQRVVFSDGGATSNFPIHFFDSPLPTRPTFGLHLTEFDRDEDPDLDDPTQAVEAPRNPNALAREEVLQIDSLGTFFSALVNAAQNWRDNAQAALPGYRDRVAHIKLAPDEGGLNLVMPPETIIRMNDRGDRAGEVLADLFAGPDGAAPTRHWNDHRFTRYRVTMGIIERWLRNFRRGYTTPPADAVTTAYADRIGQGRSAPYAFASDDLLQAALRTSDAYVALADDSEGRPSLDDADTPRPPSVLRSVPPV